MLGIKRVLADGTIIELERKHLLLEELQDMIASGTDHKLIEFVHYVSPAYGIGGHALVVNESGLLYNLPHNYTAMKMISWKQPTPLVGNVVFIEWEAGDF